MGAADKMPASYGKADDRGIKNLGSLVETRTLKGKQQWKYSRDNTIHCHNYNHKQAYKHCINQKLIKKHQ